MNRFRSVSLSLLVPIILVLVGSLALAAGRYAHDPSAATAIVDPGVEAVPFDGSVLDLPPVAEAQGGVTQVNPRLLDPTLRPLPDVRGSADLLASLELDAAAPLKPGLSFDGLSSVAAPLDVTADVGPRHFVEAVNGGTGSVVRVHDKAGHTLATFALEQLWDSGPCAAGGGNPSVLYDRLADRWLLGQLAGSGGGLCIAVSKTPDPTGAYHLYSVDAGAFPDHARLAAWSDAYLLTASLGGRAYMAALDRASMLEGLPARQLRFTLDGLPGLAFNLLTAAGHDGALAPPAGSPAWLYRPVDGEVFGGSDRIELFELRVDWSRPEESALSGPTALSVRAFDLSLCGFGSLACVPQPGTDVRLDPWNEAPSPRLQHRSFDSHETLLGSFTVDADGADTPGLRWFELRRAAGGAWAVFQEGTFAPQDGLHRWAGSVAMDGAGNIALAYSASAAWGSFPAVRLTGRRAGDSAGAMAREELLLAQGEGASESSRWSAAVALLVDPQDDRTLWLAGEIVGPGVGRQARVGTFGFDLDAGPDDDGTSPVTPNNNVCPASCDCCTAHGGLGCSNDTCEAAVCAMDAFCCSVAWDGVCAGEAGGIGVCVDCCNPAVPSNCCEIHGGLGCSDSFCEAAVCAMDAFCCSVAWDGICVSEAGALPECVDDCCTAVCGDGIVRSPETCDPPGALVSASNCCIANGGLGCDNATCQDSVCSYDPFCCSAAWDGICASEAQSDPLCAPVCATCGPVCTYCGDGIVQGANGEECELPGTELPSSSDCCFGSGGLGCSNPLCTTLVCDIDPFCCSVAWDGICASEADSFGCCEGPICSNSCCVDTDRDGACDGADSCPLTPNSQGASNCCVASGGLGCTDAACQGIVCGSDAFCCSVAWDGICAQEAKNDPTCLAGCALPLFPDTILALPDKATLSWLTTQDIAWVRGQLVNVSFYGIDDFVTPGVTSFVPSPELPPSGQGLFWLVRPNCPLGGSWSSGGPAECGATMTCPFGSRDQILP